MACLPHVCLARTYELAEVKGLAVRAVPEIPLTAALLVLLSLSPPAAPLQGFTHKDGLIAWQHCGAENHERASAWALCAQAGYARPCCGHASLGCLLRVIVRDACDGALCGAKACAGKAVCAERCTLVCVRRGLAAPFPALSGRAFLCLRRCKHLHVTEASKQRGHSEEPSGPEGGGPTHGTSEPGPNPFHPAPVRCCFSAHGANQRSAWLLRALTPACFCTMGIRADDVPALDARTTPKQLCLRPKNFDPLLCSLLMTTVKSCVAKEAGTTADGCSQTEGLRLQSGLGTNEQKSSLRELSSIQEDKSK